jgi:hypothetical protein
MVEREDEFGIILRVWALPDSSDLDHFNLDVDRPFLS